MVVESIISASTTRDCPFSWIALKKVARRCRILSRWIGKLCGSGRALFCANHLFLFLEQKEIFINFIFNR
jgi:hypothetical protein